MQNKSIHLLEFDQNLILKSEFDKKSLSDMHFIQEICSAVLSIRKAVNIRVRVPLKSLTIYTKEKIEDFYLDIIKNETNIKTINIEDRNFTDIADEIILINMKSVGLKFKSGMKNILDAQKNKNWKINNKKLEIANFILDENDFQISYKPKNDSNLNLTSTKDNKGLLLLDISIDDNAELEGFVRDLIRKIQTTRKDENFNLDDKISTKIITNYADLEIELSHFTEEIKSETLSKDITFIYENINKDLLKITDSYVRIECKHDKI